MHALPAIRPIRQLNPLLNLAADYVLSRKVELPDWKALQRYWQIDPLYPKLMSPHRFDNLANRSDNYLRLVDRYRVKALVRNKLLTVAG